MLSIIERPFQDAGVSKQPIRCLERRKMQNHMVAIKAVGFKIAHICKCFKKI